MPGPHGGTLKTMGLCAFCETPTEDSCVVCLRAICRDHVIERELVCLDCGAGPPPD